jgi:hypothetical protein
MTIVKIRNQLQGDKLTKQNTDQASKTADQTASTAEEVRTKKTEYDNASGAIQGSTTKAAENAKNCSAAMAATNSHQAILDAANNQQAALTALKKNLKVVKITVPLHKIVTIR